MTQRRAIGEILVGLGRITDADVAKALEYQRRSGGYLGEALIACGIVSEDEIKWALASQYDLPYVFPKPEEIDYEAASLVSPEWALTHVALPIMKSGGVLTVVVDSPLKTSVVEDLRARTDLEIQLALASPSNIRELIRQVFARATAADQDAARPAVGLSEALDLVLAGAAPRFGLSARGVRGWAWWDDAGTIRRRLLNGDWEGEMGRALKTPLLSITDGRARGDWSGEFRLSGTVADVEIRFLVDESGGEYLFRLRRTAPVAREAYLAPTAGIISEIRLLARSGTARFVVTTDPSALGHEILPHLPELLLDPSWRSIYVHARDRPEASLAFSHRLSSDGSTWSAELDSLRGFRFDVVTADLEGGEASWAANALDVASVAFLLWASGGDIKPAYQAGVRWHIHAVRRSDGHMEWSLNPLRV